MKALSLELPIVCSVLKVRDCARYLTKSTNSSGKQIKLGQKFREDLQEETALNRSQKGTREYTAHAVRPVTFTSN